MLIKQFRLRVRTCSSNATNHAKKQGSSIYGMQFHLFMWSCMFLSHQHAHLKDKEPTQTNSMYSIGYLDAQPWEVTFWMPSTHLLITCGLFLDFVLPFSSALLYTCVPYVHVHYLHKLMLFIATCITCTVLMQSGVKRPPLQSPGLGLPYTKQQQLRGPLLPTPESNQFSRQSMFLIQCHVWKVVVYIMYRYRYLYIDIVHVSFASM